jgi:hypothetical protein
MAKDNGYLLQKQDNFKNDMMIISFLCYLTKDI